MLCLIVHADVWAPTPQGIGFVLTGGGEILAMGGGRPELPAGIPCEVIDVDGRRLVPGLIDAHVHLTGGGGETGPASRVPPLGLTALTTAGVTTAIGLLGTDDLTRDTASLIASARALRAEGLTALVYTGGYHVPPRTLTGSVRGDIVFIDECIGVGEIAISDHRSSQPTVDELLRIASDAHVAGLMTGKAGVLHLHLGDGERGLEPVRRCLRSEIPDRVFQPTHVNRGVELLDDAIALARSSGCTIDVTAFPPDDGSAIGAPAAWQRYRDAGAPLDRITISSDGGGCMPTFAADGTPTGFGVGQPAGLATALAALLAEEPPDRALPAFTTNVAKLLRLHRKGRIAPGLDADLVVLDDLARPRDVMARGHWLCRDGHPVRRGTFERAPT